ncbi:MAG: phosphate ABC transporter ATP-binding protein [Acidobacteria bacterium]|nr:phosphate ABC transporter ATP-binding protein [Acidobacteriota bacterium]MBU4307386.1 phosphate ABC transporter ATP-binding protein [Acidobacteriota bacterium]MCG2811623.1 phosphate ABC transporter ATP-binding protein PstB [Candidatus Aminicenantes bacterium]
MSEISIETRGLNLFYGDFQALIGIDLQIPARQVTALIGPSGCGKSTLLRVFNRMNDLIEGVRVSGQVIIDGQDIFAPGIDLLSLREKVGMVFQRPNPFPLTVYENIVFGLSVHRLARRSEYGDIVEQALRSVLLWDDLKDRLQQSALKLSLEQQQRLCIARVLPLKPQILLMDEPCSALDPFATMHIEELMQELKKEYTIVIVTHNMQQAGRASDRTGFLYLGKLIEFDETVKIFTKPAQTMTENYISGRFG